MRISFSPNVSSRGIWSIMLEYFIQDYAEFSTNRPITVFVLSCFIGEYETWGPMMQKHLNYCVTIVWCPSYSWFSLGRVGTLCYRLHSTVCCHGLTWHWYAEETLWRTGCRFLNDFSLIQNSVIINNDEAWCWPIRRTEGPCTFPTQVVVWCHHFYGSSWSTVRYTSTFLWLHEHSIAYILITINVTAASLDLWSLSHQWNTAERILSF